MSKRNYLQLHKLYPSWKRMFGNTHAANSCNELMTTLSAGAINVAFDVAAENTNVVAVAITVTDEVGNPLGAGIVLDVLILANASGTDFTAGTYTLGVGALGKIATVVANKIAKVITGTGGVVNLTLTNSGAGTCYVGVQGPTGKLFISSVATHT